MNGVADIRETETVASPEAKCDSFQRLVMPHFYADEHVTIYHGKAEDVLPQLPTVQLVVTSPPYNIGKEYDGCDDSLPMAEYHAWLRGICRLIYSKIAANRHVCVNICDVGISNADASDRVGDRGNFHVVPHHSVVIDAMRDAGAQYLNPVIWMKPSNCSSQFGANARFCGTYPYPASLHVPSELEYILRFRRNGLYEKPTPEAKEASILSRSEWMKLSSQLWTFNGVANKNHPAPFPSELPSRCIKAWSFVGDTVLDPFCGTGTTLVAAKLLKRHAIGVDSSERYCEMAATACSHYEA
jgi:site-specific DNA-methyltransferase (adenine-specific)